MKTCQSGSVLVLSSDDMTKNMQETEAFVRFVVPSRDEKATIGSTSCCISQLLSRYIMYSRRLLIPGS